MVPLPSDDQVLLLDRSAEMAKKTGSNLHNRFGSRIRVYVTEKAACRAVLAHRASLPVLAVNDRVGLNEVETYGGSFDAIFRRTSPLSLIILFSDAAFR